MKGGVGDCVISLVFTLISNRYFRCEKFNFLSFWNAVMQKPRFPSTGSEEQGGLHGPADACAGQTLPIWQKWLIGGKTQALWGLLSSQGVWLHILYFLEDLSSVLASSAFAIQPGLKWSAPDAFPVPVAPLFWGVGCCHCRAEAAASTWGSLRAASSPAARGLDREQGSRTQGACKTLSPVCHWSKSWLSLPPCRTGFLP